MMYVMVDDCIPNVAGNKRGHKTQRVRNPQYINRKAGDRPPHSLREQPRRSDERLRLVVVHQVSRLSHVLPRAMENVAVQ